MMVSLMIRPIALKALKEQPVGLVDRLHSIFSISNNSLAQHRSSLAVVQLKLVELMVEELLV